MSSLDHTGVAARRSNAEEGFPREQLTWIVCALAQARTIDLPAFSLQKLSSVATQVAQSAASLDGFAELPSLLGDAGVGLLYEPSLPKCKIDGLSFTSDDRFFVALSGRGKRLDKVLFTLLHELAHFHLGHLDEKGYMLDVALDHEATGREGDANATARAWLLPEIPGRERITKAWVTQTANQYGVNEAVIVGRLQHEKRISWQSQLSRELLNATPALERW